MNTSKMPLKIKLNAINMATENRLEIALEKARYHLNYDQTYQERLDFLISTLPLDTKSALRRIASDEEFERDWMIDNGINFKEIKNES